ncbi:MAG: MgsA ATPase-like [Firmicutes bacterium]|nr:MgsA ATPase-like [Bacillota bacterium]
MKFDKPLADRIRPESLDDVAGQSHIIGKNKILNKILESKEIPNMIFFGPPGVGKTTVANIIAKATDKKFYKLNATNASISDIKSIIGNLDSLLTLNGVLLYLDEIQNFNKKQQQSLLEYTENGKITLIASTTENPYFYVYNALLSRSAVFEFKMLEVTDIVKGLRRALEIIRKDHSGTEVICEDDVLEYIAECSTGDLRRAINVLQLSMVTTNLDSLGRLVITIDAVKECFQNKALNYDKMGDNHYDILSAFQKSIRGSDADAAVHYLARLVKAGDLLSICRRLMVIAAEDVGLAYPQAVSIVKSCVDCALQLGFPEARIPLAEAVILLATSPKSNSAYMAIDAAMSDLDSADVGDIPANLKDGHYAGAKKLGRSQGYIYPHGYPNSYAPQQYLPDKIKNKKYYVPGINKNEQVSREYWEKIKNG